MVARGQSRSLWQTTMQILYTEAGRQAGSQAGRQAGSGRWEVDMKHWWDVEGRLAKIVGGWPSKTDGKL